MELFFRDTSVKGRNFLKVCASLYNRLYAKLHVKLMFPQKSAIAISFRNRILARRRTKDSWLERLQDCKKVRIEVRTPEARNSLQWRNENTMFIGIFSVFNREKL